MLTGYRVPTKVRDDIYPSTGSLDHRYLGSQEAQWDEGGVDHNAMIQRGRGIGTKSLKANGRLESSDFCSLIGFDGKATGTVLRCVSTFIWEYQFCCRLREKQLRELVYPRRLSSWQCHPQLVALICNHLRT